MTSDREELQRPGIITGLLFHYGARDPGLGAIGVKLTGPRQIGARIVDIELHEFRHTRPIEGQPVVAVDLKQRRERQQSRAVVAVGDLQARRNLTQALMIGQACQRDTRGIHRADHITGAFTTQDVRHFAIEITARRELAVLAHMRKARGRRRVIIATDFLFGPEYQFTAILQWNASDSGRR